MKKVELAFIPCPGDSHLRSTIEFAKLLVERDDRFSITFLVMKPVLGPPTDSQSYFCSYPEIQFIDLPPIEPPPTYLLKSPGNFLSIYIESYKASVRGAIVNHILSHCDKFAGLVIDMFCTSMIDVANELLVPSYMYLTSGASCLGFLLHLPTRHDHGGPEWEISGPDSVVPCFINPVPGNVLPDATFDKEGGGYACFLNHARRFKETSGIFVNTFLELENHAVSSMSIYNDVPHVYTVGPLISHKSHNPWRSNQEQDDAIMKWLDDQFPSSVVFLCFGTWGSFSEIQLKEIAIALEQSGFRFLWSIRATRIYEFGTPVENINYSEILPEGFLGRTQNKGFICDWTPQVEVLAHKAVGCFVSHCGWNSILESIWHGVPIVTWPIYAEQHLNAFQMVKDLELAVELKLDYRPSIDAVVKADEILMAVRRAMEEDSEVRKTAKNMNRKSREALAEGGSSFASVSKLVEAIVEGSGTYKRFD